MKTKISISFFIFLLGLSVGAAPAKKAKARFPQSMSPLLGKCAEQISVEAENRKSANAWQEYAPTEHNGHNFRTPTTTMGRWLELNIDAIGTPILYDVTNSKKDVVEFTPNCKTKVSAGLGMDFSASHPDTGGKWFNDKDLQKLVSSGKTGLIYVWSPEMTYSAQYYKYFRDTAKKMKMEFVAVIDPRSKSVDIEKAFQNYGIPPNNIKMNSVEIYMRNATIHYPTSLVYAHGKISPRVIVGVLQKPDIEAEIKNRIGDL